MKTWITTRKVVGKVREKVSEEDSYNPNHLWSFFSKREQYEKTQPRTVREESCHQDTSSPLREE